MFLHQNAGPYVHSCKPSIWTCLWTMMVSTSAKAPGHEKKNVNVSREQPNTSHNTIQRYRHLIVVEYLPEDRSAATRPKKASGQPRRTPPAAAVIVRVLFDDDIIIKFICRDYITLKYNNIPNTLLCEKRWTTLKARRYVCGRRRQ